MRCSVVMQPCPTHFPLWPFFFFLPRQLEKVGKLAGRAVQTKSQQRGQMGRWHSVCFDDHYNSFSVWRKSFLNWFILDHWSSSSALIRQQLALTFHHQSASRLDEEGQKVISLGRCKSTIAAGEIHFDNDLLWRKDWADTFGWTCKTITCKISSAQKAQQINHQTTETKKASLCYPVQYFAPQFPHFQFHLTNANCDHWVSL